MLQSAEAINPLFCLMQPQTLYESDTRPTDAEAGLFLPSVRVSFRFDFKHSLTTR